MEFHFHGVGCCHYHPELLNMVIKVTSQDSQDCNQTGLPSLNQGERNKEQQIQDQESQKVLTVGKTRSDWTWIDCNTLLSTLCHAPHVSRETSRLSWLAWQQRPTDTVTKTARWLCSKSAVLWFLSGACDQRKKEARIINNYTFSKIIKTNKTLFIFPLPQWHLLCSFQMIVCKFKFVAT